MIILIPLIPQYHIVTVTNIIIAMRFETSLDPNLNSHTFVSTRVRIILLLNVSRGVSKHYKTIFPPQ